MGHSLRHLNQIQFEVDQAAAFRRQIDEISIRLNELGISTTVNLLSNAGSVAQQGDKLSQLQTRLSEFLSRPPEAEIIIQEEPITDIIISEPIISDISPIEIPQIIQSNSNILLAGLIIGGLFLVFK